MTWVLLVGTLLILALMIFGVVFVVRQGQQRRARFISVITRARGSGEGSSKGEETNRLLAKQKADIARKLKAAQEETEGKKKDRLSLRALMQQAGIEAPLAHYWIGSAIFAAFVWLLLLLTSWPPITKGLVLGAAFMWVPKMFLKWKAKRRQKKFLAEFADALDAMGRLLQAGMPMTEAVAMASREFTGPLKEEMVRIYENQKIGVPLGEAALISARRVPLAEVQMFATAVQIQSETGSSLSEVLYNLSSVIRARFRLRRKVQALSSEAKSSAAIIGCLPLLVMFALYLVRPEYIGQLFTKPLGKMMLYGSGIWMSFGILMMRQMINFKI
jgi:tight adherence protein B